jgi:hypothetical protein
MDGTKSLLSSGIAKAKAKAKVKVKVKVKVQVKVKFTLEQITKAQRGSRGIALLFL